MQSDIRAKWFSLGMITIALLIWTNSEVRQHAGERPEPPPAITVDPAGADPAGAANHSEGLAELAGRTGEGSGEQGVQAASLPAPRTETADARAQASMLQLLGTDRLESEPLTMTVTGYYAGPESTGKTRNQPEYGITYSGVKVRRGAVSTVAADPKVLPIGTLIYVPDYGYGIVADTGSAIKGRKLDLYFETKQQIYDQWGKRRIEVVVLHRGNGKLTEEMVDRLNRIVGSFSQPAVLMQAGPRRMAP